MERIVSEAALPSSGSTRKYSRLVLEDGGTAIRVVGTDADENAAFIALSGHFRSKGIAVPQVLEVSPDGMSYIQEDLGAVSLWDAVARGRERAGEAAASAYSPAEEALLIKAVRALPKIQFEGASGLDFSVCYPEPEFGGRTVDFDLNYFKYCFLKPSGAEFNEIRLQRDFDSLKAVLLEEKSIGFMYRDFQTRNVMIRDGEPWFIDFQGGRRGPVLYDIVSFVYQARSRFADDLKWKLIGEYAAAAEEYCPGTGERLRERIAPFALFRCLQTLGAYGFRGLVQGRRHFVDSIPAALAQIQGLLAEGVADRWPYLAEVLGALSGCRPHPADPPGPMPESAPLGQARMTAPPAAAPGNSVPSGAGSTGVQEATAPPAAPLVVDVLSFSYRRGLPDDDSGNGGGYIFDCRAIHNPGRYDRYKHLTGRDRPVIEFLEQGTEAAPFLDHVFALLDAHTAKFLSRGFTHFQVAFGCTGGQHRSVYCAERTAAHLREKFGVQVRLTHRESQNWPTGKI